MNDIFHNIFAHIGSNLPKVIMWVLHWKYIEVLKEVKICHKQWSCVDIVRQSPKGSCCYDFLFLNNDSISFTHNSDLIAIDSLLITQLLRSSVSSTVTYCGTQSAHSSFRLLFSWLLSFTDRDTLYQHEVCRELLKVNPKPPQYYVYLWKVLQIIKLPIWHLQPIPWAEIHNVRSLLVLKVSPKLPKVTLRLLDKAHQPGDTVETRQIEVCWNFDTEEDESDVREEEMDILMISCLMRCFPIFCCIEPQTCNISRNQKYLMKRVGDKVHRNRVNQKWKLMMINLRKIRQTQPVSCNNAVCSAWRMDLWNVRRQVRRAHVPSVD